MLRTSVMGVPQKILNVCAVSYYRRFSGSVIQCRSTRAAADGSRSNARSMVRNASVSFRFLSAPLATARSISRASTRFGSASVSAIRSFIRRSIADAVQTEKRRGGLKPTAAQVRKDA